MPYDISWYVEKRVIHVSFYGTLTLEEMANMFEDVIQYRDAGEDPVHILTDVIRLERFPTSLSAIRQLAPLMEGFGVDVIIGVKQPILGFLIDVTSQLIRMEIRRVDTLKEALAIIARLDATLAELAG